MNKIKCILGWVLHLFPKDELTIDKNLIQSLAKDL